MTLGQPIEALRRTRALGPPKEIDSLMDDDLNAKSDRLWEQGARKILGDERFEQLYPDLKLAIAQQQASAQHHMTKTKEP